MVLGAAFYSRIFPVDSDRNRGLLQPARSGSFGPDYGGLTDAWRRERGFHEYWDEDAQAAWLWNGREFVSFESPEAVYCKCEYVKERGLRGLMYWEHGGDPSRELLGIIARSLTD